jgi:twitching motility protein PilI
MSKRHSLVEFQQRLTQRLQDAPRSGAFDALLGISLGEESWLVRLTDIAEVVPCPPIESVPWTKHWLLGATNFRGQVYSVVDLAAFVGTPSVTNASTARLLLLNKRIARGCALLVNKVHGMRNPSTFTVQPKPANDASWIRSRWIDADKKPWQELDIRQLAVHPTYLDVAL